MRKPQRMVWFLRGKCEFQKYYQPIDIKLHFRPQSRNNSIANVKRYTIIAFPDSAIGLGAPAPVNFAGTTAAVAVATRVTGDDETTYSVENEVDVGNCEPTVTVTASVSQDEVLVVVATGTVTASVSQDEVFVVIATGTRLEHALTYVIVSVIVAKADFSHVQASSI